jgi:hypothetical protein
MQLEIDFFLFVFFLRDLNDKSLKHFEKPKKLNLPDTIFGQPFSKEWPYIFSHF